MNKLLIICGPTAVGKTKLAIKLASRYQAELISADSRQVYQSMDIGTGKDIDKNSKLILKNQQLGLSPSPYQVGFHTIQGIPIWLLDIVKPDQEFHLTAFVQLAWKVIEFLRRQNKLPLIVGGTGLYLKALTQPLSSIHIPPNKKLRPKLQKLKLTQLQQKLIELNQDRFEKMNSSDQKNPRRLIRAIEIEKHFPTLISKNQKKRNQYQSILKLQQQADALWIGLKTDLKTLYQQIDQRVNQRLKHGIQPEIKHLLKQGYHWQLPSFSALGYFQWQDFFTGKTNQEEVVKKWKFAEHAYARRQLTWFKKNPQIHWFDPAQPQYDRQVVALTDAWYHKD